MSGLYFIHHILWTIHSISAVSSIQMSTQHEHEPCLYLQLLEVQFPVQHLLAVFPLLCCQEAEETFPFHQHLGKLQLDDRRGKITRILRFTEKKSLPGIFFKDFFCLPSYQELWASKCGHLNGGETVLWASTWVHMSVEVVWVFPFST